MEKNSRKFYKIYDRISALETLDILLHKDSPLFAYKKKDGSIRVACGTKKDDIIIANNAVPKDCGVTLSARVVRYFDCDKLEWRGFLRDNLIWTEFGGLCTGSLSEEEEMVLTEEIAKEEKKWM